MCVCVYVCVLVCVCVCVFVCVCVNVLWVMNNYHHIPTALQIVLHIIIAILNIIFMISGSP